MIRFNSVIVFFVFAFFSCSNSQQEEVEKIPTQKEIVEEENALNKENDISVDFQEFVDSVEATLPPAEYIILCPYCEEVISDTTTICANCNKDTRNDAALEMLPSEYEEWLENKRND